MSRMGKYGKFAGRAFLLAAALVVSGFGLPAHAQYVGRVDTNQDNNAPVLRATAVLEYTGDVTKPNASRLIPIAVWDGERYQPGALYMAQPVPLTVEAGTRYILQVAGNPKGFYDVKAATDTEGSWIALGNYAKPAPPNYAKLRRSRTLPRIMVDDDKPHFAHVPPGDTNPGSPPAQSTKPSAAPVDPDRPTLHRRADDSSASSDTSGASASSGSSGGSTNSGDNSSASNTDPNRPVLHRPADNGGQSASTGNSTPADPDRPTLHHHEGSTSEGQNETSTDAVDPNRPRLEYGKPANLESLDAPSAVEAAKLASAAPADVEKMAAVSDAANRPTHSFVYSWDDPEDQKKAQATLETLAQRLLAKSPAHVTNTATNTKHVTKQVTNTRTARKKASGPALPVLADEQFHAYELSYGGGATLVFTASTGEGDAERFITLIAKLDFSGSPLVLFKQITSQRDLDIIPRMNLVDAVDTDADNRAELIFALQNTTGRQYAIYRVANGSVEQVFKTGS